MSSPSPVTPSGIQFGRIYLPNDELHKPDNLMAYHPQIRTLAPSTLPHVKEWAHGPILDQGQTSECTAFCGVDHINCEPHAHPDLAPVPHSMYLEEKSIDRLPPGTDGSTMEACATILQHHGLINPPLWAFDEWTIRKWVLTQGPVAVGTNWYDQMFYPNAEGYVTVGGNVIGGHAYLITGYDYYGFGLTDPNGHPRRQVYKLQNSWGQWAHGGMFFMGVGDLARLISEEGEGFDAQNWDGISALPEI